MFRKITICFVILIQFCNIKLQAMEYLYILNDKCINELYSLAQKTIDNEKILILRDSRGLLLRFELEESLYEKYFLEDLLYKNITDIEKFLAKIKNPAIIEVHTQVRNSNISKGLKNWEYSTVLANNLERLLLNRGSRIESSRIRSIGYGEFLPAKNTPNNGGKYLNRVDIIVLCNITGE